MTEKAQVDIKDEILDSAIELFAQKGYHNTTVRDICSETETYQLAINYHFGSKENLYRDALLRAYDYTEESNLEERYKHFSDKEQLKKYIEIKMNNIFISKKRGLFYKILSWEQFENKSEVIEEIIQKTLKINHEYFIKILNNISKGKKDRFIMEYYAFSFLSQVRTLGISNQLRKKFFSVDVLEEEHIIVLINEMYNLIISGITSNIEDKGLDNE